MKKQCTHCKLTKHYDDFGYRQVKGRTYVQPWCRICRGAHEYQIRIDTCEHCEKVEVYHNFMVTRSVSEVIEG